MCNITATVPDVLEGVHPEDAWFIFDENPEYFYNLDLVRKVIDKTRHFKPYRAHLDKWRNLIMDAANADDESKKMYDLDGMVLFLKSNRKFWCYGDTHHTFNG